MINRSWCLCTPEYATWWQPGPPMWAIGRTDVMLPVRRTVSPAVHGHVPWLDVEGGNAPHVTPLSSSASAACSNFRLIDTYYIRPISLPSLINLPPS